MSLHSTLRNQAINLPAADAPKNAPPFTCQSDAVDQYRHVGFGGGFMVGSHGVTAYRPVIFTCSTAGLASAMDHCQPARFMDATLWQHLAASLGRIFVALLAAVVLGVPTGIAMGLNSNVRGVLDPLIEIYRPVPPLAYLPLMVIWFGIGETSKILLIYLAIFAPVTLAAVAGVRSVAHVRVRAARALGASRWQVYGLWCCPAPCRRF